MILEPGLTSDEILAIYLDGAKVGILVDQEKERLQEQLANPNLPDPHDSQVVTVEPLTVFTPGKMLQSLEAHVSQTAMKEFLSKDTLEGVTYAPGENFDAFFQSQDGDLFMGGDSSSNDES